MPGLKKHFPDLRFSGNRVTPDEIDQYIDYVVMYPSVSTSFMGTSAKVAASAAGALAIASKTTDYPRNLLYGLQGTADAGGTWTVNGTDQFGQTITETVALGTAAAGTPATGAAGTKIFATVTSGTFTATSDTVGSAVGLLGLAAGTAAGSVSYFGLPVRIKAAADVKSITWVDNGTIKAVNGGTVSSTYVGTAYHTFNGSAVPVATDIYKVRVLTTRNAEYDRALS